MAISLVGSGESYEGWSTTLTLSISSGSITEGDAMLALIEVAEDADLMSDAPAGWTLIDSDTPGGSYMYCYYKQAGAGEGNSYTWTISSADRWAGCILVFTGVNITDCFGDLPNGTVDTNWDLDSTAPSITIDSSGNVGVHLNCGEDSGNSHAPPGGTPTYNEVHDYTPGSSLHLTTSWATYTSTGASGTKSGTFAGSNTRNTAWHVELLIAAAAGDLTINVNDSPSINEAIGRTLPLAPISKFDSVTISELRNLLLSIAPTVFDQVSISELMDLLISIRADVFDSITASDVVSILKDIKIDTYDQATITETIALLINILAGAQNTVNISEYVSTVISEIPDLQINEADVISAAEFIQANIILAGLNIQELITVVENIQMRLPLKEISEQDLVTIAENILAAIQLAGINRYEEINITEAINLAKDILADVSDSMTVAEYVNAVLHLYWYEINTQETMSINENTPVSIVLAGIDNQEAISLTESIIMALPLSVSLQDLIGISEYIVAEMHLGLDTSEFVTVSEVLTAIMSSMAVSRYETATIAELAQLIIAELFNNIDLSEIVSVSEYSICLMTNFERAVFEGFYMTDLGEVFFDVADEFAENIIYAGNVIPAILTGSRESLQDPRQPSDELLIVIKESDVASPEDGDEVTIESETWYVTGNLSGSQGDGTWKLRISKSERRVL